MVLSFSFLFFLARKGEKDCITKKKTENNPLSERPTNITSQPGTKTLAINNAMTMKTIAAS